MLPNASCEKPARPIMHRMLLILGIAAFWLVAWPIAALALTLTTGLAYRRIGPTIPLAALFGTLCWVRTLGL